MLILGLFAGFLVGMWFGINIGKGKPIYSYPFNNDSFQQKAKRTADEVLEDTKRVLRKSLD